MYSVGWVDAGQLGSGLSSCPGLPETEGFPGMWDFWCQNKESLRQAMMSGHPSWTQLAPLTALVLGGECGSFWLVGPPNYRREGPLLLPPGPLDL